MNKTRVGSRVTCADGWAGTLARLVQDPGTGQTTHLVIDVAPAHSPATVSVGHVMAVGYDAVFLDLTSRQLLQVDS
jgi:hypothetical protein